MSKSKKTIKKVARKNTYRRTPPKRSRRGGQVSTVKPHPPVGEVERVLAFDSSSRACGWSVFDEGQLVAYGHFRQIGPGHGERLMNFRAWLLHMFASWQPTRVIYEAPYQGRMRNTFGVLSKYVAMIEEAHYEHYQAEIDETGVVPAHVIKKVIGARKGKDHEANKKIVVLLVNETFGLSLQFKTNDLGKKVSQDDDADAIALNWAWHLKYRSDAKEAA